MKKMYAKSIILFFLFFSSCFKENIPLSNVREDYLGDQLRIDGLYYLEPYNGYISYIQFYYRNGINFQISFSEEITDPANLASILTKEKIESHRKRKYNWGIFKIKGNEFLSERWQTPEQGNYFATTTWTGNILSDTSFIVTKIDYSKGVSEGRAIWHFYPFSPKPDSTNVFIK